MATKSSRFPCLTVLSLVLSCVFASTSVLAQESEGAEEEARNSVEVFVGGTFNEGISQPSMGLNYERRVWEHTGLGILVENTAAEEWVFVAPITWHVGEPWKIWLAPGIERSYDEEENENEFLVRIGAAVEMELLGWAFAPEFNLDFVNDEVKTVVGVTVGWEF